MTARVSIDFCGEIHEIAADSAAVLGRVADIAIDDNPYLHRRFLEVRRDGSTIWLANVGSQLTATVADADGLMQAWLSPGARVPVVFARTVVWFTAGPTTYEFDIIVSDPSFQPVVNPVVEAGSTTIGKVEFTPDQRLLILALAEDVLRRGGRGAGAIPSSIVAASRLGWTSTKFNRKLDNVCQKIAKGGVRGLHGNSDRLASTRKARLVEYAIAARLVTVDDLILLDAISPAAAPG